MGEGVGITRTWATAHFFTFMVGLGTVTVCHLVCLLVAVVALLLFVCFYKLRVCTSPLSGKSIRTVFPTAVAHFMSPCYILMTQKISDFSIIIISVMVTCDQRSLILLLQKIMIH